MKRSRAVCAELYTVEWTDRRCGWNASALNMLCEFTAWVALSHFGEERGEIFTNDLMQHNPFRLAPLIANLGPGSAVLGPKNKPMQRRARSRTNQGPCPGFRILFSTERLSD